MILSSATAIACLVFYFWQPKKSNLLISYFVYLLIASTSVVLILDGGGVGSPFIAIWVLVVVFSGIFGLWGTIPVLITSSAFIATQYMQGKFNNSTIAVTLMISLLPILASSLIWHGKSDSDESDNNKSYKNLANELNEIASKSEVVINAIGDGVIAIDTQGVVQLINPAAQILIGWGKQDALALNYKSVFKLVNQKDETLEAHDDPVQQALNGNQEVRTNSLALMTSSDKKIMISLVVSPVGEIGSGVIVVFRDITKEKSEEREQAEFISTASHEMRTPVASIEGYLGLALNPQTAQVDARARDFILKAHASAEHLGHLFQDLLDVAKSEDGRLSNKPKIMNIVNFLHDIIQGLNQKATEKGLQLIYKPMPDDTNEKFIAPSYSVNLDNDHIREIINNLVENAIKYTPRGEILVDVNGDDEHVIISVQDSGIGIPAEDMPHLFQKFYRVDNKDTHDIGGTGLGLYLSRRLAEIMGGRIWAESVYGKGSTFFLELPRVSNQEASRLIEQEAIAAKNEANQNNSNVQYQPNPTPLNIETPEIPALSEPVEATHSVPRGQALTPEQIAAYVVKQRALAQQQVVEQTTKPQSIPIADREDIN